MRSDWGSAGIVAALCFVACGGAIDLGSTDGVDGSTPGSSGGSDLDDASTATSTSGSTFSSGSSQGDDAGLDTDGGSAVPQNVVDPGYYRGAGSFWVDGGAYPDLPDAATEGSGGGADDAAIDDASPGCAALAACCGSLSPSSESLCSSVVSLGDATNCSTELAQLQGGGDCTGVTVLASQVQVTPNRLVSDGRLLFWTTTSTPGLLAMPVGGGAITALLNGPPSEFPGFLAVDDANIYLLQNATDANGGGVGQFIRIPKNGAPATLINEPGVTVIAATTLGGTAYWVENQLSGGPGQETGVKSAPLLGGAISSIVSTVFPTDLPTDAIGVTSTTAFVTSSGGGVLYDFPLSTGVGVGGLAVVPAGSGCDVLTSDTAAIYCAQSSGSNLAIGSDGTSASLGSGVNSSYIVFDDTYAYWANETTVGTIMKSPKAGGTATILARDTSPTAIAVDATSVYWADIGGYIKSIPK
jgi:hypothetical protein